MTQTCQHCQTVNQDQARFCSACGATLGATVIQGRTVVATGPTPIVPSGPMPSHPGQNTVARPVGPCKLPGQVCMVGPMTMIPHQREHTIFDNDASTSMGKDFDGTMTKLEASIRAAVTLVVQKAQIDPLDEVGLVMFRGRAQRILELCPLGSNRPEIIRAIQSLTPDNGTDINEGLKAARDMFDWQRSDIVRRIILLTDGHGGDPLRTADDLKSRGVVIDVIGIGPSPRKVDEKLLKKVASVIEGESHYRFITDAQTLIAHYTQLAGKTATA